MDDRDEYKKEMFEKIYQITKGFGYKVIKVVGWDNSIIIETVKNSRYIRHLEISSDGIQVLETYTDPNENIDDEMVFVKFEEMRYALTIWDYLREFI